MPRTTIRAFLAGVLFLPGTLTAQSIATDATVVESIEVARIWLDAQLDYEQLPSLNVAIVHDQELVWSEAFGFANTSTERIATTNTLYSICSISKLFTSVALMQLRDRGLLTLRDPVSQHLPWYGVQQQYDDSSPVTIEGILTHSAGLPRESDHPYWTGPEFPFPTKEQVIAGMPNQETWYSSRTKYQYSNLGLSLAGYIVEEVSGQPYHEYVREHVLNPLGLNDTYSEMPSQHIGGQLAMGYSGMTRQGIRVEAPFFEARGIAPAAGYASTVEDLSRFAMWQFRLRGNREEVLHGYTLAEMQRAHFIDPVSGTRRGLGFGVYTRDDKIWVGHGGSCPGFQTSFNMQNDEKIATIAFLNARQSPHKYSTGIYNLMGDAIRDAVERNSAEATEEDNGDGGSPADNGAAPDVDFSKYVGRYVRGLGASEVAVVKWRGSIAMLNLPTDTPRQSMTKLKHVEGDTFVQILRNGDEGRTVIFDTDENGEVLRVRNPTNFAVRVR